MIGDPRTERQAVTETAVRRVFEVRVDVHERGQQNRGPEFLHVGIRMRGQDLGAGAHGDNLSVTHRYRATAQRRRSDGNYVVGSVDLGHASPPATSISVVASSGSTSAVPLRFSTKIAT